MIPVNRAVVRQLGEVDRQAKKPYVLRLEPGGKLIRIKIKGQRRWFTVTVSQLWYLGAANRAAEIRADQWLSAERAAARMGMPETTFLDLVEEGVLPEGLALSQRTIRWNRDEVDACKTLLAHLLQLGRRAQRPSREKS